VGAGTSSFALSTSLISVVPPAPCSILLKSNAARVNKAAEATVSAFRADLKVRRASQQGSYVRRIVHDWS
jgi:hypothetical protein